MRSCMNCKHTEETIFDNCKKCICEESEYYDEMVDERDLCRCWDGDEGE